MSMTRTGLPASRMNAWILLAMSLLQAFILARGAEAAVILSTGGSMAAAASAHWPYGSNRDNDRSDSSTLDITPGKYGVFNVHAAAESFITVDPECVPYCVLGGSSVVDVRLEIQPNRLSVNGKVDAYSDAMSGEYSTGSGTSTLNFDVDAPMQMTFAWSGNRAGVAPEPVAYLSQDGNILFACVAEGGCASAPFINGSPGYPFPDPRHASNQGRLTLMPGSYVLAFSAESFHGAGVTIGGSGSLTLTEVPLPAAFWLFGAALLSLAAGAKRGDCRMG